MLPVSTILGIAKFSGYQAAIKREKSALFGPPLDATLPEKILVFSESIGWAYSQYGETEDVKAMASFLLSLCDPVAGGFAGAFALRSGGELIPIAGDANIFPIHITSAKFESDGVSLNDARIVGKNIALLMNDLSQRYIYAPTGFTYTPTGIIMKTGAGADIPDFNATINSYDIIIIKINV